MVLDSRAVPMRRIWCLYEVSRAKEFGKELHLIVDDRDLSKASIKTLKGISDSLRSIRAFTAGSTVQSDRDNILYRILDKGRKLAYPTIEIFMEFCAESAAESHIYVKDNYFSDFDAHICSLMATPLLAAGLKAESKDVCMCALGMEAEVTVKHLDKLTQDLEVDVGARVETRYGTRNLPHVFAKMGRVRLLQYVLDRGADTEDKDNVVRTALISAADEGHIKIVALLLERGASIDNKNNGGHTAFHQAAFYGHTETVRLLMDRGADVDTKNIFGGTALHRAASGGQTKTITLLLDQGMNINTKKNNGQTPLHNAAARGHTEAVRLLMDRGANVDTKMDNGKTVLDSANDYGHTDIVFLLTLPLIMDM